MNGWVLESIVENTKRCLTFITKDRPISEEALVTFLTEVDATLNSRPLTQILMDISYFNILILVHFIFTKQSLFFFSIWVFFQEYSRFT